MAETVARMRSIEYMNLFPPPSEIAARALRLFFQFASTGGNILNFTRLHIHRAEVLLSTDEEMKDAIARLQTIQELVITGAGERTFTLLCGLQSSLTNARIAADADASRNIPLEDRDARQFLSRPMGRLETLSLSSSIVCSLEGPSYYAVRTLFLRGIESPVTGHYTSAFPFLSLLRVEDCSVSYRRDGRGDRYTSGREHPIADSARLMALFNLLQRAALRHIHPWVNVPRTRPGPPAGAQRTQPRHASRGRTQPCHASGGRCGHETCQPGV